MNRTLIFILVICIGLSCCRNPEKEFDKLALTKKYFKALDQSNISEIPSLLADSLLTKETAYDYEQIFSLDEYVEWMRWDSVFNPTYKILAIEKDNDIVKATVSKIDERIFFLHEVPIVTTQLFRFEMNKIVSIETVSYDVFNDSLFVKNRDDFLRWINENNPEINDFINDQTREGGMTYLKAIETYKNRE